MANSVWRSSRLSMGLLTESSQHKANDADVNIVLAPLSVGKVCVRHEARMLLGFGVLDRPVLPTSRSLLSKPTLVALLRSVTSENAPDTVDGARALPVGCVVPRRLRQITDGDAIGAIRLVGGACSSFN
jgi:hypothetical protein